MLSDLLAPVLLLGATEGIHAQTMIDLGTLGGTQSSALDINEGGQVIGDYRTLQDQGRVFLYTPGKGMMDLGLHSQAVAINDAGQVTGASYEAGARAFLYTPGVGIIDLGTLSPCGYGSSWPWAMNNSGQVVGYATAADSPGGHASFTPQA